MAKSVARRWPHLREELLGQSIIYLYQTLLKSHHVPDEKMEHYLCKTLKYVLQRYAWEHAIIRVPYKKGNQRKPVMEYNKEVSSRPNISLEFAECLWLSAINDKERLFVKLRIAGHKDRYIARHLCVTPNTVHRIRRKIHRRFKRLWMGNSRNSAKVAKTHSRNMMEHCV